MRRQNRENGTNIATGVLRGALTLSVGTAFVRAASAFSQLALVIWLAPTEFGFWAAAVSSLAFFTSVVNFGEINGFLSGRAPSFARLKKATRKLNALLMAVALIAVIPIWILSGTEVGVLALIVALAIPAQGEADTLYALSVQKKVYRRVVWTQAWASAVKLALSVGIAVASSSALAIAIPAFIYNILVIAGLRSVAKSVRRAQHMESPVPVPRRERISWAINTLVMSLPLQIGFFVAQFVTDAATLGLYYLSFQLSLGISGLLAVPLARVSLSALAEAPSEQRTHLSISLGHALSSGVTAVVALVSMAALVSTTLIPTQWQAAIPVTLIMLASLPIRLVSPVIEGYQQARNQWWQSTLFNTIECVATVAIALTLSMVSLPQFALLLSAWRLGFGILRMIFVLRDARRASLILLSIAISLATIALVAIPFLPEPTAMVLGAGCTVVAAAWFATTVRTARTSWPARHIPPRPVDSEETW